MGDRQSAWILGALLLLCHTPLGAQPSPRPDQTLRLGIGAVAGRSRGLIGHTPAGYRPYSRCPMVVVIPDRSDSPQRLLKRWPLEVFARKGCVVVIPSMLSSDYGSKPAANTRAFVAATVRRAREVWSIDPEQVFLVGVGQGTNHALDCAWGDRELFAAVAAVQPTTSWEPPTAAVALPGPTLVLSVRGKKQERTGPLLTAALSRLGGKVRFVHDPKTKATEVHAHLQRVLEWFLDTVADQRAARRAAAAKKAAQAAGDKGEGAAPDPGRDVRRRTEAASGSKEQIVAIRGEFDQVETVLGKLEIPHVALKWGELAEFDLAKTRVVLINCSNGQEFAKVVKQVVPKLKRFVNGGGYVFGTDWAVRFPLADVFPKYVAWIELQNKTEQLPVRPARGAGNHPLLQNVFPYNHPDPVWQLDPSSWLMKFVDPKRVTVLLESAQMRTNHGNGAVGAVFHVGRNGGKVLNVVSHFNAQGAASATTPMWQLIVNFINEAKAAGRGRGKRR